jgi:hypothetical protein
MMTPKQPNSRRSLDVAISRLARNEDGARRIRLVMANTIVGQMLPGGVVKGSSALKLRFGNEVTRFTRDLDTARNVDLEVFITKLRKQLEHGWNGFTGNVVRRTPARPEGVPGQYVMQPFEVKLSYNQKSWLTVPLEIGHNEIGDADEPEHGIAEDIVNIFTALGFSAPDPIPLMPLHHQISQKLHGASGAGSDRAHELVDLQVIVSEAEVDYAKTKEACLRLFAYRGLQEWPPLIRKGEDWDSLYESQAESLLIAGSVDEAIAWTNNLIAHIDSTGERPKDTQA